MASEDIVKQIVLKFKADGQKEVSKEVEKMTSKFSTIDQKSFKQYQQGIEKITKDMSKIGMEPSKALKGMQKTIQDIATKDLKRMYSEINTIADRIEKRQRILARNSNLPIANNPMMAAAQNRDATQLQNMMNTAPPPPPGAAPPTPPKPGEGPSFGKFLGGAFGAIGGAGAIVNAIASQRSQTLQNQTQAVTPIVKAAVDMYEGNLLNGIMEVRHKSMTRASNFGMQQQAGRDIGSLLTNAGMIGGGILGIAEGVGATALTGGLGAIPGGILAAGGIASIAGGAKGLYNNFFGAGSQANRGKAYQEKLEADKAMSLDPYFYQKFMEQAPGRAEFQFKNRMSDELYLEMTKSGAGNFFNRQEAQAAFEAIGARTGIRSPVFTGVVGRGAMNAARNMNLALGTTVNLTAGLSMFGAGGAMSAESNLTKIFTKAVSLGVKDSGLTSLIAENTAKQIDLLASTTGERNINVGAAAEVMTRGLGGGPQDAMSLAANERARAVTNSMFNGGGTRLSQNIKTTSTIEFLKNKGKLDPMLINSIMDMSEEQMAMGGTEFTKAAGISSDDLQALNRQIKAKDLAASANTSGSPMLRKALANIKAGKATEADYAIAGQSAAQRRGQGGTESMEGAAAIGRILTNAPSSVMTDQQAQSQAQALMTANRNGFTNSAAGQVVSNQTQKAAEAQKEIHDKIERNVGEAIKVTNKVGEGAARSGGIDGTVGDLQSALANLTSSINDAAKSIRGTSAFSKAGG